MSMLAERKRKTKWVINPTKKPLWSTDSNGVKFGKGLMEKMGWSVGKGLGANEQGMAEPLKVSYKNDTKGMGFKGNDNDWIEYQDEFNSFLMQLSNNDESFVVNEITQKNEVKSLEEKSKWSKSRVHYQKFTRGKDLSKYSENDLACILGTNKTKKEKSTVDEIIQEDSKTNDNLETHFGVSTINRGSIQDYFKKKWICYKKSRDASNEGDEVTESSQNENSCFSTHEKENVIVNDEKKSKRKKLELSSDLETTICPESNDSVEIKKKKKKREKDLNSEEEPEIKKRKRNDFHSTNDALVEVDHDSVGKKKDCIHVCVLENKNDDCNLVNTKINSKNILKGDVNLKNELKDQKKRKKEKKEEGESIGAVSILNDDVKESCSHETESAKGLNGERENKVFQEEFIVKKKKKKSKKEKCEIEGKVSCDALDLNNKKSFVKEEFESFKNYNSEGVNSGLDEDNVKRANETGVEKKKKDKKGKLIETEEIEFVGKVKMSSKKGIIKDANETEVIEEVELVGGKKKKKDKKENPIEKENYKITNEVEFIAEAELVEGKKKKKHKKESDMNINEIEFISDGELVEEKKKKRNKKESDENTNDIEFIAEAESLEGKKKKKSKEESDENTNDIEFIAEAESLEGKKKKKHKKENDTNINEIEFIPERELQEGKKKKRDKKENPIEKESDKNISETEVTVEAELQEVKKKKKNKEESEKNTKEVKFIAEAELVEVKKKKKDKMENDKNTNEVEFISEGKLQEGKKKKEKKEESDINTNEIKVISEAESIRRKKKKKSKKENSTEREEIENLTNDRNDINNHYVEENKSKKKRQATPENESVRQKKRKKSKREKSLEIQNCISQITNEFEVINERKPSPEIELIKKKKKNKKEEIEFVENHTNHSVMSKSEEENIKSENKVEDVSETLVKKKKKKKDKIKEVSSDQNSESFSKMKKTELEDEEKNTQNVELDEEKNFCEKEKIEETNIPNKKISFNENNCLENNSTRLGYNTSNLILPNNSGDSNPLISSNGFHNHQNNLLYSNIYNNKSNTVNRERDGENGVQNHKVELLDAKKADKFYPGSDKTQRVLRLLHWSDFKEFRGSNLENLAGYGFQKQINFSKSV